MATTPRPTSRPKRRHAASASRILVGGVSVAATLGMTANWGIQARATQSVELDTVTASPAEPQQRIVVVRRIIREVYAEPTGPSPDASGSTAVTASSSTPVAPPRAPAPAPAPAATPTLPSAALAPPPAPAPAPATSSNGS
jgi:hypothetical protein